MNRTGWRGCIRFPFAMIVGLVTLAFMASREKKEMPWTRETIILLIFTGWMLFTTFFAFYSDFAWLQWNKVWKIQMMVILTALIITDRRKLHWLIWVIALSLGFYGIKAVFTIMKGGATGCRVLGLLSGAIMSWRLLWSWGFRSSAICTCRKPAS
jgi:hypothetical protein